MEQITIERLGPFKEIQDLEVDILEEGARERAFLHCFEELAAVADVAQSVLPVQEFRVVDRVAHGGEVLPDEFGDLVVTVFGWPLRIDDDVRTRHPGVAEVTVCMRVYVARACDDLRLFEVLEDCSGLCWLAWLSE